MKLRLRIILFFSLTFLLLLGIAFVSVYLISDNYREQGFYQRLKDQAHTTIRLLLDVKEIDNDLLKVIDKNTVNTLYNEKTLIFDSTGSLIYSSLDDTKVFYAREIIDKLKKGEEEMHFSQDSFEIYAERNIDKGKLHFAIVKAHDKYGIKKIEFLALTLIFIYLLAMVVVFVFTFFLSRRITNPINTLTREIDIIKPGKDFVTVPESKDEIAFLAAKFNELLARVEKTLTFQRNLIHHISHELKTPIAVMISNIERTRGQKNPEAVKESLDFQRDGLMQLAGIIDVLLEISKYETGVAPLSFDLLRIDELLFECMEELQHLKNNATYDFSMDEEIDNASELTVNGNERMLKMAFFNLLNNAIQYSNNQKAIIRLRKAGPNIEISFINNGTTLKEGEEEMLYQYFFRGNNSRKTKGFGLGLVLTQKIVGIHQGHLEYNIDENKNNKFTILLPLAAR